MNIDLTVAKRMIWAELLRLRKKRGFIVLVLVAITAPIVIATGYDVIQHASYSRRAPRGWSGSGRSRRRAPQPGIESIGELVRQVRETGLPVIRAGASGFLLKDVTPAQLLEAIRVVAAGEALLAPSVTRRLLERFATTLPAGDSSGEALAQLTARETEVLRLVAGGRSNAEIASDLVVSEATVKTHISSVLRKLGLRDRVQAVIVAYETGLVRTGGPPPR